jgi:PKD repeat protein
MAELSSIRKLIIRLFFGVILLLIWDGRSYAQTADFTNDNFNCGSSSINFSATMGNLNANDYDFFWEFGDGRTASGQNVNNNYLVMPGQTQATFTVKLTATSNGIEYLASHTITVRPAPGSSLEDVNFPTDPFNNCGNNPTPQNPNFTITVKNTSSNPEFIANYVLDWGDGSATQSYLKGAFPSTLTHSYTKLGLFKLGLTTTGDNGCTTTKQYDVKNQSNPGVGLASPGNTEGCAPVSFSFKFNGIKNNDAGTNYLFDFGDGQTVTWTQAQALANDSIITHEYTRSSCDQPDKAYTLKVKAYNSCSYTLVTAGGIKVSSMPVPDFSAVNLCENEPVQFNNYTNSDCSNNVSFTWDFGDGSPTKITTDISSFTHTFPSASNVYTVTLTVHSSCQDQTISKVFTLTRAPLAAFTLNPSQGCLNLTSPLVVNATNQSTGEYQSLLWSVSSATFNGWTFSQGGSSSTNPQFSFTKKGNYTISLIASNNCSSNEKRIRLMVNDLVYANLVPSITSGVCESYTFDATNTNIFKIDSIQYENVRGSWNISPATDWSYISPSTKDSLAPKIAFTAPGTYTISVNLTNGCGTITKTTTLFIKETARVSSTPSATTGCAPKQIGFTDQSTGTNLTHLWTVSPASGFNFINSTLNSKEVSIQFTNAGIYTVTHIVTGDCNQVSQSFTITISAAPIITFQAIGDKCDLPPYSLIIDDNNFKLNNNGVPLTSIKWSVLPSADVVYIDGTTETSIHPHFQFNKTGQYTVNVEVVNDCGTSNASQVFRILEHAVENATSSTTNGCRPLLVSFSDHSNGDLLVHNWSVSPVTDWTMSGLATAPSPAITFNKAGIYTVTHKITNQCGSDQHDYIITVKDIPSATFAPFPKQCNSYIFYADQQNFNVILNQNDPGEINYLWTVTPDQAVTFINNTDKNSQYPNIQIADTGIFVIKATLTGSCGSSDVQQSIGITKGPQIALTQNLNTHCLPADLTFTGTVYGQNLTYQWSILPNNGTSFQNGTSAASPRPLIRFTHPGPYEVTLKVSNDCDDAIQHWNDTIIGKPTINLTPIPDTCDNYTLKTEKFVTFQDNGNAITGFNWTITPNSGFEYIDGTTKTSEYPHILFKDAATYQLTIEATNYCGVSLPFTWSFTVDNFVQVTVGADSTFCTNTDLIKLTGIPPGGNWRILPSSASALLKINGNITYFDPSVPGIYTLTYHRGNTYCFSEAIRKFTVVALPIVDAGRDFSICSNETQPYTLTGTPVGGTWTGSGVTGNTFSANGLAVGSYILKYSYTDPTTLCLNTDQLVARVLDVPVTGFNVQMQGCKDQPITFIPFGQANTIFNWDFGDGQTNSSSGPINHVYRKGDTFTVNMVSADQNNCALSTSKKISIQGDIILPIVSFTPSNGCGPLPVTFSIDTTGTTGNGQKHKWDFGNGVVVNDAITGKVITYNPGLADTSYTAHLTVSNNCFTKTVDYIISVRSKPNTNFSFPRSWVCSPATVHVKNLTIDRSASFYWDFDDGTTSTEYEPTHVFTTGKIAKEFNVKLVARNGCGKDSVTKILLVKPNSLEAFIKMSVLQACPGDIVAFKNLSTDTVSQISSFYWDFGDGTIVNTWDATHAYTNSGKYTVKLFIDNGCSQAQTTEQIDILPVPNLLITSLDTICKGDTLKLEGSSPGVTLINGKWDFGDGSSGTGTNTFHVYNTLGWHTITFMAADAASILKCAGLKTKKVYIKDTPPQLSLPDLSGCAPFSISIPSPGTDAYLWNYGDDNIWTASSKHTYFNDGSQPIRKKVTVLSENNFLFRTTSFFWVTIYPSPVAKIGVRSEGGYPEVVYFKNLSTNSNACQWLFPDGNIVQSCDSVSYRFYRNGSSRIYLRTTNQYGCTDTTSIVHQTLIKGLFVPNALQPSNADPLVKIFKPIGIGLKTYHLGIYDIWDNLIWETEKLKDTQTDEGWNGQTGTGKELPQGVYIWRISATFIDGTSWKGMKTADNKTRTEGTITLIR